MFNGKRYKKKKEMEALNDEALEVTLQIMKMVRRRVSGTPVYLFNACAPISDKDNQICDVARFECIEGVRELVMEREREGRDLAVVNDGHWNKEGNQIVSEWLAACFRAKTIL